MMTLLSQHTTRVFRMFPFTTRGVVCWSKDERSSRYMLSCNRGSRLRRKRDCRSVVGCGGGRGSRTRQLCPRELGQSYIRDSWRKDQGSRGRYPRRCPCGPCG